MVIFQFVMWKFTRGYFCWFVWGSGSTFSHSYHDLNFVKHTFCDAKIDEPPKTRIDRGYPLVICYMTMGHHHFSWENPLFLAIFHSYVSHYQRVPTFNSSLWICWQYPAISNGDLREDHQLKKQMGLRLSMEGLTIQFYQGMLWFHRPTWTVLPLAMWAQVRSYRCFGYRGHINNSRIRMKTDMFR